MVKGSQQRALKHASVLNVVTLDIYEESVQVRSNHELYEWWKRRSTMTK